MTVETFWKDFLEKTGNDAATQYFECFRFDVTEQSANELLELVLSGKKRATTSSLWAYELIETSFPSTSATSCFSVTERNFADKARKNHSKSNAILARYEGAQLPVVGDYSIVTDWDGNPRCVIETTAVTIIPFNEMTYDICKREGEDDNLESWQQNHRRFFTADGKANGYTFSEDMPVVFEDFAVVYQ